MAFAASVTRGYRARNGAIRPILSGHDNTRKGRSAPPGKSWKPGEEGCPLAVDFTLPRNLRGSGQRTYTQGDSRLKKLHFVHPPKSGGTSFGNVIVAIACEINRNTTGDGRYLDCCQAPSTWCGVNCEPKPGCSAVFGCDLCSCHHIPRMGRMGQAPSVTIIRHPMTRFVSGYFYRAHSPNWDRFNIRPEFSEDPTYPFKYSFDEYLEMPEYHNILVKM